MKVALFAHYSDKPFIPYYVITYLQELKRHNDEVWLITNDRDLSRETGYLQSLGIKSMSVKNQGYDFGMWHRGLQRIDLNKCKQLTLANDSCILFRRLDAMYAQAMNYDYYGAVNSHEINYHIQSFFLVLSEQAIPIVAQYFKDRGIIDSERVQDIIEIYEVGLSQHAIMKNLRLGSYVNCNDFKHRDRNVTLLHGQELLDILPMVKTKLTESRWRPEERSYLEHWGFDFDFDYLGAIKERHTI